MHTAAVDSEGNLYTWGFGGSFWGGVGGLGHGDESEQPRPKLVQSLLSYGAKVGSVSCGEKHTLILTDDGEVSARRRLEGGRGAQARTFCLGPDVGMRAFSHSPVKSC